MPRVDVEQRIADELGVSRRWLMTGEGDKLSQRIPEDKAPISAAHRSAWRYGDDGKVAPGATLPAGEVRAHEMLASIRLLIGDHTDLQIIARVHEMLDDKNFSMLSRLLLVQALLDELHHRHHPTEPHGS